MTNRPQVTIYTDGGSDPNPGPGGWGVVLIDEASGYQKEMSGGAPRTTNNRMELTAAIEALNALNQPSEVVLYTDSRYVKNGITKWITGWKKRGWTKSRGGEVQNVDLWKQLDEAIDRHDIEWRWVKGHAGNTFNERADALATQEIRAHYGNLEQEIEEAEARAYLMASARGKEGFWGVVVTYEGKEYIIWGMEEHASSNRLYLLASIEVMEALPPGTHVQILTNSDYLRNGASKWINGWRRRDFTKKDGSPLSHREAWMYLDDLQRDLRVEWPSISEDQQIEFEDAGRRIQEEIEEWQRGQHLDEGDAFEGP